ncbi:phage tail tube protein [Paenibacillus sp. FSL K6-2524]|uniref:phage tail tube protein n=1 Tax=Paenibacillus sp. FSL K6-2524 TaxID=2954516 RepID=UPI0030FC768C
MPLVTSGVFPVFNIEFKIGTKGRASTELEMLIIKDMETFQIAIDTNVEEWTPMETEGWTRRLATGKGFAITLNGKRHVGDPGNDYVANTAWKSGLDCSSKAEIVFPDGSKLVFDCIVSVSAPNGGDSTAVSALECELMSDGKPVYTPATGE